MAASSIWTATLIGPSARPGIRRGCESSTSSTSSGPSLGAARTETLMFVATNLESPNRISAARPALL
jgi:hypothetical protein